MKFSRILLKKKASRILKEFECKDDAVTWKTQVMEAMESQRIGRVLKEMGVK